jgi:hypothetical protein
MPTLLRIDNHIRTIGTISEDDLAFLREHLVAEGESDHDYFVDGDTILLLVERGAPPSLTELLRSALAQDESMDIAWREGGAIVARESGEGSPFR